MPLLRGARVVDGSGGPSRIADVRVVGTRIAEIGDSLRPEGETVVNLHGLVLSPGFIDVHTHLDAQVLWDPSLTPSSWHGVTSVVMGNCGFGIAPARAADRSTLVDTLKEVEGMSGEALHAGVRWEFETFNDYLSLIERGGTQINVSALIGHSSVRIYVMGDEAWGRPATVAEIGQMRRIVADALNAGARGFSTSTSGNHIGAGGRPVPSRFAEHDELLGIADALRQAGTGVFQAPVGVGMFLDEFSEIASRTGRPVTWLGPVTGMDYYARREGRTTGAVGDPRAATLDLVSRSAAAAGEVWPQISARPVVVLLDFQRPKMVSSLPAFGEVLSVPAELRRSLYLDPAWRARARVEYTQAWGHRFAKTRVFESQRHAGLKGSSIGDLAVTMARDPFELMLDLALDDDFQTRYQIVLANDDEDVVAELLQDRRTLIGLSDAGAHGDSLCDAIYPTYLLGHWVREKEAITVEEAIWRLAAQPASIFGFSERGQIQPGFFADLVAFDARTVAPKELERVFDLPAGADRLTADSIGIEHMWVGGTSIRRDGQPLDGPRPGTVIRD